MFYQKKTTWITGASSGIGEAIAYAIAQQGGQLILSARRQTALERVQTKCEALGGKAFIVCLDLANPDSITQAFTTVTQQFPKIDVLVNNGGISQRGLTWETDMKVDRRIMEVNYFGTINLTKKVIPLMIAQNSGAIAITSSVVGKFGFPLRSAYSASKHALHGFFDSLRAELGDKDISITLVCPGRINTNISLSALTSDGTVHGQMDDGQAQGIPVDKCAQIILKAVQRKKPELYIGRKESMMIYFRRYVPSVYYRLAKKLKAK